jgi:hypothetical protein
MTAESLNIIGTDLPFFRSGIDADEAVALLAKAMLMINSRIAEI